jgi:glyoxylase-like metal-dependent hydrolase (beta-lactamase superfamily II)
MSEMKTSLKKLMELPLNLLLYPGHGETSIIVEEKKSNPFLNSNYERIFF